MVSDFIDFYIHLPTFLWQLVALSRGLSGRGCQTLLFTTVHRLRAECIVKSKVYRSHGHLKTKKEAEHNAA